MSIQCIYIASPLLISLSLSQSLTLSHFCPPVCTFLNLFEIDAVCCVAWFTLPIRHDLIRNIMAHFATAFVTRRLSSPRPSPPSPIPSSFHIHKLWSKFECFFFVFSCNNFEHVGCEAIRIYFYALNRTESKWKNIKIIKSRSKTQLHIFISVCKQRAVVIVARRRMHVCMLYTNVRVYKFIYDSNIIAPNIAFFYRMQARKQTKNLTKRQLIVSFWLQSSRRFWTTNELIVRKSKVYRIGNWNQRRTTFDLMLPTVLWK